MQSRWRRCATRAEAPVDASGRRTVLRRGLQLAISLSPAAPAVLRAQGGGPIAPTLPLRFGVLPSGGAVESRARWAPLLADMGRALGRSVTVLSVTSYESLDQAVRRNEVDIAMLTAKMALDAVTQRRMRVLAQVRRREGDADHRAVLVVRKDGALNSLAGLLATPGRWRLARGDSRSVSGFILPQVELFLPNRIAIETAFRSELVDTHQATALAVANGDADVATNNTTDLQRFREQFPAEAARLQVIWRSAPTPPAQLVLRRDAPPALRRKLRDFLVGYGRGAGPGAEAERAVLRALNAALGYEAEDDTALLPAAELEYQQAWQQTMNAAWVNEAARQSRLQRIEQVYARQVEWLRKQGD
ncbi:phosphate/phosphite/phosphonate ABC transporter substrate-binding protein [Variovorax sp. ZT4R33]|uniref:phosphate/phosphite/phosphonate ABC transporter substrate-binding protein n=1 Tax=Variovorax sp. ZT4R33 TaxID=3443743 RepID=UPI003F462F8E